MPSLTQITNHSDLMAHLASFCHHFPLSTLRCAAESISVAARQPLVCSLVNYIEKKAEENRRCQRQSRLPGWLDIDMSAIPSGRRSALLRARAMQLLSASNEQRMRQIIESVSVNSQELQRARIATAAALRAMTKSMDDIAAAIMMKNLEHTCYHVRALCVSGLLGLVTEGHDRILAAMKIRLVDESPVVRCEVLEAFTCEAESGKNIRIEAVAVLLETETTPAVIETSTNMLRTVASNEQFFCIVSHLTRSPLSGVRQIAVNTLRKIPHGGDKHTILALVERLKDECGTIRWDAVDALKKHTDRGDKRAISAATSLLDHSQAVVRRAALELIRALIVEGDEQILATIARCKEDDALHIRQLAAEMLHNLRQSS